MNDDGDTLPTDPNCESVKSYWTAPLKPVESAGVENAAVQVPAGRIADRDVVEVEEAARRLIRERGEALRGSNSVRLTVFVGPGKAIDASKRSTPAGTWNVISLYACGTPRSLMNVGSPVGFSVTLPCW